MKEIKITLADQDYGNCASKEPFALQVIDDSMEPEFPCGCIVIIEPAQSADVNQYVLAELADGELILRQLTSENNRLMLSALNAQHAAQPLPSPQHIRGIVVQRAGRRRKLHKHY